ncbi:N-acetylmannosamine-6-phosphate 2-epimerase [Paenibacillus sp. GD4]|uniref:N-acetylmannosamine-6-phosphate 2-epimerase n=1 Tax=Paenibacillus sp. GD4 TaxID=3068890 RepID=UPI0027965994|nr:N-acetylmannosamine-6-phosphate 2-epimerase [Paenibacillus sp. GD4]MDQ1910267.1 N-acetylmannosamine-6-phosphate 2-epimerase [Paenibacillus sp. GD4]
MRSMIPKRGLVVSCQALPYEPLYGSHHMAAMARAAGEGGACGIRANSPEDISAIREAVGLPIIGLWKRDYKGFDVYITPTLEDAIAVYEAGADIVALDATSRPRPDGLELAEVLRELKKRGIPVMADISTYEEGVNAAALGADYVSTTLSGYTPYSQTKLPNLDLVEQLSQVLEVPTVAEGGVSTPEEARSALDRGAHFVVVGSAITRPQLITAQFAASLGGFDA